MRTYTLHPVVTKDKGLLLIGMLKDQAKAIVKVAKLIGGD